MAVFILFQVFSGRIRSKMKNFRVSRNQRFSSPSVFRIGSLGNICSSEPTLCMLPKLKYYISPYPTMMLELKPNKIFSKNLHTVTIIILRSEWRYCEIFFFDCIYIASYFGDFWEHVVIAAATLSVSYSLF